MRSMRAVMRASRAAGSARELCCTQKLRGTRRPPQRCHRVSRSVICAKAHRGDGDEVRRIWAAAAYDWSGRAGFRLACAGPEFYVSDGQPVSINGVDAVCTGIGDEAQHDPRWLTYPIRVEFSNGGAQYLSGAHVELSQARQAAGGARLRRLLGALQAAPGNYKVDATLLNNQGGGTRSATFSPPAKGQKRVVLQFKLAGEPVVGAIRFVRRMGYFSERGQDFGGEGRRACRRARP